MAQEERCGAVPDGDAEAISHFRQAVAAGRHWYIALLEAMGLWASAGETCRGRTYRYLIDGEAFDWLLLAERLCEGVEGLPESEKEELLLHGRPPVEPGQSEVRRLIGSNKYRQYLNYFYGVTVETALLLATEEEVHKERWMQGYTRGYDAANEAYRRIYEAPRAALLKRFRQEKGRAQSRTVTLDELKEFTYWLFKYRLERMEKARVASDTRKALGYLKRQWARHGSREMLATDQTVAEDVS